MPSIIGQSTIVVEHDGLTINELAGNVATGNFTGSDNVSVAHVFVSQPTAEPWLTLDYDEWLCLLKGTIEVRYFLKDEEGDATINNNNKERTLSVNAGETCFIGKGERFRPVFPNGNVEYIAICIPAFKPERCIREEDTETSQVTARLRELHQKQQQQQQQPPIVVPVVQSSPAPSPFSTAVEPTVVSKTSFNTSIDDDIIYHMCQKKIWDDAVKAGVAYYPPTFEMDGGFTHATAIPQRLIQTANHFYTGTVGDWICIQLSIQELHKIGIVTRYENPKPVGTIQTGTDDDWNNWECPHIFGGIPTQSNSNVSVVIFPMVRNEVGQFIGITGMI